MTVKEALAMWLRKKLPTWSEQHAANVTRWCEGWLRHFGSEIVGSVAVRHVEALETERADGRRSASALNQERTYLKNFFAWCRLQGLTAAEPVAAWEYRRPVVKREYVALTREEEDRLVAVAPPWLGRFVRFAI